MTTVSTVITMADTTDAATGAAPKQPKVTRRRLLTGGALVAGGALSAAGITAGLSGAASSSRDREPSPTSFGEQVEPFYGPHQAGIATPAQAHASFVAFDLQPGVDRAALGRLMRLWTDDAARLTQGQPPLADTEPELAVLPARLTITFGFGRGLLQAAGLDDQWPDAVGSLPSFSVDRLQPRWSGGDLLIQICADDPVTVSHAQRMLIKDSRPFATVRWIQQGFLRSRGAHQEGQTQRNLLGQLDGTTNPKPGTPEFDAAVWVSEGPEWLRGGSTLVLRRIRLDLDDWDRLGRVEKEYVLGRRLDNGAPLTGVEEHDPPDFDAIDESGLYVIPEFSHIRRAHVPDPRLRMFRRFYNYDQALGADGQAEAGMIFAAYQADVQRQFVPVQRKLAEADLLNKWTIPIGSAVFAIPPGCEPGGWIGERLLA